MVAIDGAWWEGMGVSVCMCTAVKMAKSQQHKCVGVVLGFKL